MQDVTGTGNIEQPVLQMGPQEGLHRRDPWERLYKRADSTKMRRCSLSRVGKALDKGSEAYRQVREGSVWNGGQGQSTRLEKERREHSSWSGTAGRVALAEGSRAWGGPTRGCCSLAFADTASPTLLRLLELSFLVGRGREGVNKSPAPTGVCVLSHSYRKSK